MEQGKGFWVQIHAKKKDNAIAGKATRRRLLPVPARSERKTVGVFRQCSSGVSRTAAIAQDEQNE
jgi:hypothetical protein